MAPAVNMLFGTFPHTQKLKGNIAIRTAIRSQAYCAAVIRRLHMQDLNVRHSGVA